MSEITILLADNHDDYREALSELLNDEGFLVKPASNPEEAIRILEEEKIDICILDIRLRNDNDRLDTSGLQIAKNCSSFIPKIMLTGFPSVESVKESLKPRLGLAPAVDFISKESGAEALIAAIKEQIEQFDVSLCYHPDDKQMVIKFANLLVEKGIRPWLDEWELRPGTSWLKEFEKHIPRTKSATVFIGKTGIGSWQNMEIERFIYEFEKRKFPIIPVILPGVREEPDLPAFLKSMVFVDARKADPDPFERLICGITGKTPKRK